MTMQLYTHPVSGAQLAKPLAQPHVTRFADVFTDHAPYIHGQPSPFASRWLEEGKERMEVSAYCIHRDKPSMRVRPADWVYSRIREGTIPDPASAVPALVGALEKLWGFVEDLRTSNPGYLGKLVLQDYAQLNEALIETPRALALAKGGKR